jgi:hypothetical protein
MAEFVDGVFMRPWCLGSTCFTGGKRTGRLLSSSHSRMAFRQGADRPQAEPKRGHENDRCFWGSLPCPVRPSKELSPLAGDRRSPPPGSVWPPPAEGRRQRSGPRCGRIRGQGTRRRGRSEDGIAGQAGRSDTRHRAPCTWPLTSSSGMRACLWICRLVLVAPARASGISLRRKRRHGDTCRPTREWCSSGERRPHAFDAHCSAVDVRVRPSQ